MILLTNTIKNGRITVESLLGGEITSNPIQHVRIKPPQRLLPKDEIRAHVTATDWHQDRGVDTLQPMIAI